MYTLLLSESVAGLVKLLVTVALPPRPETAPPKVILWVPETVVVLPFNQTGLFTVRAEPLACRVTGPVKASNVVAARSPLLPLVTPKALSEAMITVPALSWQAAMLLAEAKLKILSPERTSVPEPALVQPVEPAMTALMLAVALVPRVLTVMVGLVPARVSVLAGVELLSMIQLPAVAVALSLKTRFVRVRALSKLTVRSAVMSLVKFAVLPEPLATPGVQLPASLQRPLASTFHVPAWAWAACGRAVCSKIAARKLVGIWNFFIEWVVFLVEMVSLRGGFFGGFWTRCDSYT